MLEVNNTLEELWFGMNQIGDSDACETCATLKYENKTAKYMQRRNNDTTDRSVHTMIQMIQNNRSIKCLYLENNRISKANQQKIEEVASARVSPMSVTSY